ncbi:MAG: four helix bundle protein [Phycisphaerae bacterium]
MKAASASNYSDSGQEKRKVRRFDDLDVWQTARELARGVYRAAESQPLERDFAMLNQMKRAAISISSNIAEGFERGTRKQQIEFCFIAKGSAGELRSQIMIAHDVRLLDDAARDWLLSTCETCIKQLQGYISHLRRTQESMPGPKYREVE